MPQVPAPRTSAPRSGFPWLALAAAPVAAAVAWVAFSALKIDHQRPLPPALPGRREQVGTLAGLVNLYAEGLPDGVPLLLVHSINAAASAYEVRPLFLHYRDSRPVYAIDLPGFGFSERLEQLYTPRMMVDAIHAAVAAIRARHGGQPVDCLALSLSCEYAGRAALEHPDDYRSLALISPTGFDQALSGSGPAQSTRGSPTTLALVATPAWSQALFDLLVSRPSIRFFLQKTWGSRRIDEGLFEYDELTAQQPGARHVVWSFLAGYLFPGDISRIYRLLDLPIWTAHGTRGDFVDFSKEREIAGRPNWRFEVFDTGAFPHFEALDLVTASYDRFIGALAA